MATFSYAKDSHYECGIHDLQYRSHKPGCPLCAADREVEAMRRAIQQLTDQVQMLTTANQNLMTQVDMVASIRAAAPLLDEADIEFLKITFYMHRDERSVALRPTRGGDDGSIIGFIRVSKKDEVVAHHCVSVGGLAIADYLNEAINTYGQPKAMEIMTRALAPILPGSAV